MHKQTQRKGGGGGVLGDFFKALNLSNACLNRLCDIQENGLHILG